MFSSPQLQKTLVLPSTHHQTKQKSGNLGWIFNLWSIHSHDSSNGDQDNIESSFTESSNFKRTVFSKIHISGKIRTFKEIIHYETMGKGVTVKEIEMQLGNIHMKKITTEKNFNILRK